MGSGQEKNRKGFTLIEVLIVVGITAMLSSMVLTYTSTSRDQVALYVEQAKLAQTVSRAKSLALSIFARPGEQVPCGYGVQVEYDLQEYSVFSYSANNCYSNELDPAGIKEISREKVANNVRLIGEKDGIEDAIEKVVFLAPDPKTWIWHNGKLATSTTGHIYLETIQGKAMKIEVSNAGQISF